MSLINLTQEYIGNPNNPFLERVKQKISRSSKLYFASSLASLEELRKHKLKEYGGFGPTALVLLHKIKVKRIDGNSFDEDDGTSLEYGLDGGLTFPWFTLRDETSLETAIWKAGNSEKYLEARRNFGFNKKDFVTIPRIFLQYSIHHSGPFIAIGAMKRDQEMEKCKDQLSVNFEEILKGIMIPEIQTA